MADGAQSRQTAGNPERISFYVILGLMVLMGSLHVTVVLVAALFSYLTLTKLHIFEHGSRWFAVMLFVLLVAAGSFAFGRFVKQSVHAVPEIVNRAIPSVIQWATQYEIELPFTDYDSLKDQALDAVKSQSRYLEGVARVARGAAKDALLLVAGCVTAISLFLTPRFELRRQAHLVQNNLYSLCCDEIGRRFITFYRSFALVMGAQIIISAINTVLTTVFVLAVHLPYALVIIGVTFLCGLLPVVGNLISNTIIVSIGFTVSPQMAFMALGFLVVIHKLEYFLNSKIIGERIHNPLWLTLLGLIVGERLLGIPGMILAPVVLHYVKVEAARFEVKLPGLGATRPARPEPAGVGVSGESGPR